MKETIIYHGYCCYIYSDIFLDENYKYITDIHENDGDWRDEYFNPIFEKLGINIKYIDDFDDLLEKYKNDLAIGKINIWDIDFKELMRK